MVRHVPDNAVEPFSDLLQKLSTDERIASLAHTSDDDSSPAAARFSKAMAHAFDQPTAPDEFARKQLATYGAKVLAKGASGQTFTKFIAFSKIDQQLHQVSGVVTCEQVDRDQEVCDYEKSVPFYRAWSEELSRTTGGKNLGNLRSMHQLNAIGHAVDIQFRDAEKAIYMTFVVEDPTEWAKVVSGTYTGFSQGGRKIAEFPDPVNGQYTRYIASPSEVSLVDFPALPAAHFDAIKANETEGAYIQKIKVDGIAELLGRQFVAAF